VKRYLIKRVLGAIPVVFGVLTGVFLFLHLVPGDPVDMMLGENALQADRAELRSRLKLDQPLHVQYGSYLGGVLTGDLGYSFYYREPVVKVLMERFPATLELTFAAMLMGMLIAFPLGIFAAVRRGAFADRAAMMGALFVAAMPSFWLGPLLITWFSVSMDWFPVSGRDGLASLILPALTMGVGLAALLSRMLRTSLGDILREDFMRTAHAKGAHRMRVLLVHGLRNALLPVVTILGLQFGALLSGAVITETIFSWPGVGRLLITAIQTRDYPLVQGGVLLISLTYVFVNLLTDLTYAWLDPRIRLER
jgi:peptide/nickel transport system permease protein